MAERDEELHLHVARHARTAPRSGWKGMARISAAVAATLVTTMVLVGGFATLSLVASAQGGITLSNEDELGNLPSIAAIDGGVNLLLVGLDKRPEDGAFGDPDVESSVLNDVNMLLHISEDHTSATVVSFPRDLFVPIPSCTNENGKKYPAMSSQKINNTYFYGGLACTVETIENLTGLSIPFAAEVEFYGVIAMSDAIGGVEVCVAERIEDNYTQTYLDPGIHELQGWSALQFLRTRHGVGDGSDITRISNQQVFLSALARKLTDEGALDNVATLYALAKAALSNMKLSNSLLDPTRLVAIAQALRGIPLENITFVQHPNAYVPGGGGVATEPVAAKALYSALQKDQPLTLSGGTGGSIVDESASPSSTPSPSSSSTAKPSSTPSSTPGSSPSSSASSTAKPSPSPSVDADGKVVLPGSIKGTTASTVTCSDGRDLSDQ